MKNKYKSLVFSIVALFSMLFVTSQSANAVVPVGNPSTKRIVFLDAGDVSETLKDTLKLFLSTYSDFYPQFIKDFRVDNYSYSENGVTVIKRICQEWFKLDALGKTPNTEYICSARLRSLKLHLKMINNEMDAISVYIKSGDKGPAFRRIMELKELIDRLTEVDRHRVCQRI